MESALRRDVPSSEERLKAAVKIFEVASMARARFAKGDTKTQKEILVAVASNLTLTDKKLCFEARKPFFFLGDSLSPTTGANDGIGPENSGSASGVNRPKPSGLPRLRGQREDVRTYGRKARLRVHSIFRYFQKREECGCGRCRDELSNPFQSILHLKRRKRWNVLPEVARWCAFPTKKSRAR
jgi:hypothetical protein